MLAQLESCWHQPREKKKKTVVYIGVRNGEKEGSGAWRLEGQTQDVYRDGFLGSLGESEGDYRFSFVQGRVLPPETGIATVL